MASEGGRERSMSLVKDFLLSRSQQDDLNPESKFFSSTRMRNCAEGAGADRTPEKRELENSTSLSFPLLFSFNTHQPLQNHVCSSPYRSHLASQPFGLRLCRRGLPQILRDNRNLDRHLSSCDSALDGNSNR